MPGPIPVIDTPFVLTFDCNRTLRVVALHMELSLRTNQSHPYAIDAMVDSAEKSRTICGDDVTAN